MRSPVVKVHGVAGKTCGACAIWKPLNQFDKRGDRPHLPEARKSRCRQCCATASYENIKKDPERHSRLLEYQRAKYHKKYAEDPEAMRAYWRKTYRNRKARVAA